MRMDSLRVTDNASKAVATHPRVSLDDIESSINAVYYTTAAEAVAATDPDLAALRIPPGNSPDCPKPA